MFCGQILIVSMEFVNEDAPTPVPECPGTEETGGSFATAVETETEPSVSRQLQFSPNAFSRPVLP
jgi:hypothetical protein